MEKDRAEWRKFIFVGRRFAPLADEEKQLFQEAGIFENQTDKASATATVEEAKEEVERIEEKFKEHGTRKVNPYEGVRQ